MPEVILDTDILSEILKGIDSKVKLNMDAYQASYSQLTFTSATVMEILAGYRKRGAHAQLERASVLFRKNIEIVPEAEDYRLAASISGDLMSQGKVIGIVDPLIAACAIRAGFGVASGNTRHFEFIREAGYQFHLENWRS